MTTPDPTHKEEEYTGGTFNTETGEVKFDRPTHKGVEEREEFTARMMKIVKEETVTEIIKLIGEIEAVGMYELSMKNKIISKINSL